MRKLASIKKIGALSPIEGRDRIELATIDGWSVIVKKGEFQVGDSCVYIEIDSVLPEKPEFEFLRSRGFRIKTLRMAGCISQGIVFPLTILPDGAYAIEDDVTELIGVTQYVPSMDREPLTKPESKLKYPRFLMRRKWFRKLVLRQKRNGEFPDFIPKTDEVRIQNIPNILADKSKWIATEKIDGSSGSFVLKRRKTFLPFFKDRFEYIVCSRNIRLPQDDGSVYWRVSTKYDIKNKLRRLIGNWEWVAIQGECIAPKIQGNKYKVSEPDLYVFNLLYPDGRAGSVIAQKICEEQGLKFVPILQTEYTLPDTVQEVLDYAHGKSKIGDTFREGIVFRSEDGRRSFKAVDPLFLMKYDE